MRQRAFATAVRLLAAIATTLAAQSGFDTVTPLETGESDRVGGMIGQQVSLAPWGYGAFSAVPLPARWLR